MKKAILICLLVASVMIGGLTIEAKTTKKKGKARTSQSANGSNQLLATTFVKKTRYGYADVTNLQNKLINLGFKKIFYGKTSEGVDEDSGSTIRTYETKYSRTIDGKETVVTIIDEYFDDAVEVTLNKILIKFPSQSDVNAFEKSIKSLGLKLESNDEYGRVYGNNYYKPGLSFRIKGTTILIFDMIA